MAMIHSFIHRTVETSAGPQFYHVTSTNPLRQKNKKQINHVMYTQIKTQDSKSSEQGNNLRPELGSREI